jgi:NADH:ubiquinone oxidoreductase subunit
MSAVSWFVKAVKTLGPREMLRQLYHYDYIKMGRCVGVDKLGNKYFENLEEQHGRHRWVEYNTAYGGHREPTRIQPEWHGWMTHMTDNTPLTPSDKRGMVINSGTNVPFASEHQGSETVINNINPGATTPRGYKIPGIFGKSEEQRRVFLDYTADGEGDTRYKQAGLPASPFYKPNVQKMHEWDPTDPNAEKSRKFLFLSPSSIRMVLP